MAKTLVILNPVSGNGAAAKVAPAIQAALRAGGLDFDWVETRARAEGTALAEKAKRDGYEKIIAIGGDGIVHEIVNGLMRGSHAAPVGTLGVIPAGNGNDFAKMFPLGPDWREAVQRVLANRTRWFDVGKVTGDIPAPGIDTNVHYFDNGLDTGFGALAAMHSATLPSFMKGTVKYLGAIVKALTNFYNPRVKINFANYPPLEQTTIMLCASIGQCYGNAFWLTPTAQVDDGLLDVMVGAQMGRGEILSFVPRMMNKTHVGDPRLQFFKTTRLVIESPDPLPVELDGEIPFVAAHRLEIEILPKRLQVIV